MKFGLVITSSVFVFLACLVAANANLNVQGKPKAQVQTSQALPDIDEDQILGNTRLLLVAASASIVGAWIAIFCVPEKKTNESNPPPVGLLAGKFVASIGCGVTFTPLAINALGWQHTMDNVAPVATVISSVAVGSLTRLAPTLQKWFEKLFGTKFSNDTK